jgi:hypothetical protein
MRAIYANEEAYWIDTNKNTYAREMQITLKKNAYLIVGRKSKTLIGSFWIKYSMIEQVKNITPRP